MERLDPPGFWRGTGQWTPTGHYALPSHISRPELTEPHQSHPKVWESVPGAEGRFGVGGRLQPVTRRGCIQRRTRGGESMPGWPAGRYGWHGQTRGQHDTGGGGGTPTPPQARSMTPGK